jgi:two-component system chemotaxis sensor kinase CheA
MDDLINEFLVETNENIGELDNDLILLEQDPGNVDLLSKIFRIMHTIKGTCGFLDLPRLGSVAHKAEDLLGLFREGTKIPTTENISLILESLDQIKWIIGELEQNGKEPEGSDDALIKKLEAACHGNEADSSVNDIAVETKVEISPGDTSSTQTGTGTSNTATQSLRVSVDVLEDLMTMVSELVLTRNQLLQVSRSQEDSGLSTALQRLNHIVSDLQEGVMKTRMQPVGNAWSKLPRIIRDIANDLGKKIELEMYGQETELDRQVLDLIKDPLTHMVRNSADHGIERPEDRLAAGKPETGKIKLNSYHEGGHIIIEITDDGRGLPMTKIRQKIIDNKLASETELAGMSEQQIQQYIFHAGFSTAEQVTSVSGRGVGMDVVRSNIEKIGGSVELLSVEGKGTNFMIKIPLTLAIVSSLIVGLGEESFAIPQLDVSELVMISPGGANRIETINNAPVMRLRERLLPLLCLRTLLGFEPLDEGKPRYIAVIHVGSCSFGVIVDQVFDTEEIVVKPLTSLMNEQNVFSGNTILGDGRVIMILDSSGLMKTANMAQTSSLLNKETEQAEATKEQAGKEITQLLLFHAQNNNLKAIPLEHALRLEEIDIADLEYAAGQNVVQYNGRLMPVYFYGGRREGTGKKPVIVFSQDGGLSGLLVDQILDIVSYEGTVTLSQKKIGKSVIIADKATDIINMFWFAENVPDENPDDTDGLLGNSEKDTLSQLIAANDPNLNNHLPYEQERH